MNAHKNKSHYKEKLKLSDSDRLELKCEACNQDIPGESININKSLAQCPSCKDVFALKDSLEVEHDRPGRPEMMMPEGTDVLTLSDSIDIRLDWLKSHPRGALGFLSFFAAAWNGFLMVMGANLIASGAASSLLFLSVHAIVGIGLLYYLAGVYMNYTDIIVTRSNLEISHRPIKNPFVKRKVVDTNDIQQLYVNKYVSSRTNGNPNFAYSLYAILRSGQKVQLLKGMNRETQLYLEQEIERFLNIKDTPVHDSVSE